MRALSGRSRVAAIIVPCGLRNFRKCDVSATGGTQAPSAPSQSMFRLLCLPMASLLPTPRSGKLWSTIVWAAHARTIRVYVTWRAESQVQEQVEKLNGRRIRRSKIDKIICPVRRKSAQRLSMIPKSGYRFSEKIMLQHKRCVRASFRAACGSSFKEAPNCQPAAGLLLSVGCLNWRPSPTNIRYFVKLGARSQASLTAALRQASMAERP